MTEWRTSTRIKLAAVILFILLGINIYCYLIQDVIQLVWPLPDYYIKAKFAAIRWLNAGGLMTSTASVLSIGFQKGLEGLKNK